MKIVAVNASPRRGWNTDTLVKEAARGAKDNGAEVIFFDLYRLEKFTGCISCFGCKREGHRGTCVCRDGLAPVLDAIDSCDALIIGTPNYLGNISAACRALYERLIFRNLTYRTDRRCYNEPKTPVLFIMTSNCAEDYYDQIGYTDMLNGYVNSLNTFVGNTSVLISGDTLQVRDYSQYDWTMFDPAHKQDRHDEVFPQDCQKAYDAGCRLAQGQF